ncbi:MAG: hypothetical protein EA391_14495 [Balneolaceae bacterium]|nr:MAG: hypothetical protein EA391_14495 [Balneolaceae bacterium]
MKKFTLSILLSVLLSSQSAAVFAQNPADILQRMIDHHSNSISGIETMMTVTTMEGLIETDEPDTTFYRKVTLDNGIPSLQPVTRSSDVPSTSAHDFNMNFDTLAENATYEGTETIDGYNTHVLLIEDISALYRGATAGLEETPVTQEGEAMRGRLYIDTNNYVMRRISFDMQFSEEYTGTYDINFKDYRNVDGMYYSFLSEMVIDGISEQFSAEDLAKARESLQEARQQIDNASGMQRRILERTLRGTIDRLEKMLEEGGMTMRLVTHTVETNITIPD